MPATYTRATEAEQRRYGVQWRVKGSAWRRQPRVGYPAIPKPTTWRDTVAQAKAEKTRALGKPQLFALIGDGPRAVKAASVPYSYNTKDYERRRLLMIEARYADWKESVASKEMAKAA